MRKFRFILQPYKTPADRYTCPRCGKRKEYSRYIDTKTGELLPEHYGKCNREVNCGYWICPYKDGYAKMIWENEKNYKKDFISILNRNNVKIKPMIIKPDYIPIEYLKQSFRGTAKVGFEKNLFIKHLISKSGKEITENLITEYILTSTENGGIVFWQIDVNNNIRTGKIMFYNQEGKRTDRFDFVHSALKRQGKLKSDFNLKQCFFGEHLLKKYPDKPVAIVEGQSTAIFMAAFSATGNFEDFIWIATGGKNGCKWSEWEVFKVLLGRTVVLFPDTGAYEDWGKKSEIIKGYGINIKLSQFLENKFKNGQCKANDDLRDLLEQYSFFTSKEKP